MTETAIETTTHVTTKNAARTTIQDIAPRAADARTDATGAHMMVALIVIIDVEMIVGDHRKRDLTDVGTA